MKRTGAWYVRCPPAGMTRQGDGDWRPTFTTPALWFAGSWDAEECYRCFPTWREAFAYADAMARSDS